MRLSRQIALATLGTTGVVVALVAWLLYLSVERGFAGYLSEIDKARLEAPVQRLAAHYRVHGSWQAFVDDPRSFRRLVRRPEDKPASREAVAAVPPTPTAVPLADGQSAEGQFAEVAEGTRSRVRPTDPLDLPPRVTLYDAEGHRVTGRGSVADEAARVEVTVDGKIVGWLGLRALGRFHDQLDVLYIEHVRSSVLVIGGVALLLAAVASLLLAHRVVEPLLRLRDATRRLTQGDYQRPVGVDRRDELGELARDVDRLAATLAANARARQQWVADTSHELRTPLTVLRGEVEAMLDGVRPLDPSALRSLEGELVRLSKLVDDLAQLATADRAATVLAKVPIRLGTVLQRSAEAFALPMERAGLQLQVALGDTTSVRVLGDPDRLAQVFANVLENNLRYTQRGGTVRVSATVGGGLVHVRIDDSGPGVDAAHLPRLFDRLYRADPSRSRETGGAGLGLAICRQWVEAHGGSVLAKSSDLGGLCIEIELPCSEGA